MTESHKNDVEMGRPAAITAQPVSPPAAVTANGQRCTLPSFEHVPVGNWKDDLCACFSQMIPSCVMAFCCSCVLAGQLAERTGLTKCTVICCGFTTVVVILVILAIVGITDFILLLIWPCAFVMVYMLRTHIRNMFAIPGDGCNDCLTACCCAPCALAQMARHVYDYKSSFDACVCSSDGLEQSSSNPLEQPPSTNTEKAYETA